MKYNDTALIVSSKKKKKKLVYDLMKLPNLANNILPHFSRKILTEISKVIILLLKFLKTKRTDVVDKRNKRFLNFDKLVRKKKKALHKKE